MKMILNKNEAVSARSLLILFVGLVLIGAVLRSRNAAVGALPEWILQRVGTPPHPMILVRELTQLASIAHRGCRDFASVAASGFLARAHAVWKDMHAASRSHAT